MPCYLSYLLCGVAHNEYTIASTSGLLDAKTRGWDARLLQQRGLPEKLFAEAPVPSGTPLGSLLPDIAREIGFDCTVMAGAGHDTACAFFAADTGAPHTAYLTSGT